MRSRCRRTRSTGSWRGSGTGCSPTSCSPTCSAIGVGAAVPPSVVATVMVLQRLDGLSDREAVEQYSFDARWRYAAGVGGYGSGGARFVHTVLVDMRARLRRSTRPDRIFEVGLAAAAEAGLVGRRRVLDSTPLYDAVATMDTITLIRSAVRGLLGVADAVGRRPGRAAAGGAEQRGRLRRQRQAADRLGRPGRPRGVDRLPGPGRVRAAARCWMAASSPSRSPRPRRCWPRCWARTCETRPGRGVPDRPPRREGSGDLHRGPRGPARAQDRRARVRRLQGSRRDGPGHRDHHRDHGHPGQRRGRQRRRGPRRRPARRPARTGRAEAGRAERAEPTPDRPERRARGGRVERGRGHRGAVRVRR